MLPIVVSQLSKAAASCRTPKELFLMRRVSRIHRARYEREPEGNRFKDAGDLRRLHSQRVLPSIVQRHCQEMLLSIADDLKNADHLASPEDAIPAAMGRQ